MLTDGVDNASQLTAAEVSGIASAIDVPVYIVIVVSPLDRAGKSTIDDSARRDARRPSGRSGALDGRRDLRGDRARRRTSLAARQIVTELRQQYLIVFEPDTRPGWHPIDIRTRQKDLVVRARSGYMVQGQPEQSVGQRRQSCGSHCIVDSALAFAFGGSTRVRDQGLRQEQVGQVSSKVDTLSQSLEETQERTKQNEAQDRRSRQKARRRAAAPPTTRRRRRTRPTRRPSPPATPAKAAAAKADEVDKTSKRLVYTVVLSEDEGSFKFNKTELPDEAKAKIDEMVNQIKADPKGAYFEIEGHTDNVGDKTSTRSIGLERAEAVEAVSLRAAPDSAAPHERDQLRRGEAGGPEQHQGRPRAEPPRRHQGARLAQKFVSCLPGRIVGHTAADPPARIRRRAPF